MSRWSRRKRATISGMDGPRIRALGSDVTNRIAAGEIIQRPANALKELLDNSVDAGATSISVLVQDGGLKLLQVQDNGCGVHRDDLPILCRRHTTSKLASFEELSSLETLGFRGEALASLSYVSLLTVMTKRKADEYAWRATFDSGEIQAGATPCAGVDGTTVTVEDLFYNVPMRKKTLKNASEEYNGLLDVVQRYAVYHAGISFTLRRTSTKTARADVHTQRGQVNRRDAIRHVYGRDISSNLAAFERRSSDEETTGRIRLEGLLTTGGFTSAKKTKLLLFVNGRCVESPKIRRCVESVYGVLLPKGVKPFVFMSITMPLGWVDVNIHPTKTEVAMLHEEIVCDCVRQAVEETLLTSEDSRTMDLRVQTTLVTAEASHGSQATRPMTQTALTNQTTQATQATQARRPDKLVRVDAQSRTLEQLLSAPSRKNHGRSRERSSATFDLAGGVHEGLQEILKENVVIGWVDRERILVQKATKLYLLDVGRLSRDLFVQRMSQSGRSPTVRLTLRPPPSVAELLLIVLSSQADGTHGEDTHADPKINEEVAGLLCELLGKHSEWLEATFGLVVSAGGERLIQLPDPGLDDACSPLDASMLPAFLLRLAAEVDWKDEGPRRAGVADALGDLYRLREGDDERRSEAVWASVKSSLAPHRSRATDGSVVELTRLEKLYRTFERC